MLPFFIVAAIAANPAWADETCLRYNKDGSPVDIKHLGNGLCKEEKPADTYGSIGIIGAQIQNRMQAAEQENAAEDDDRRLRGAKALQEQEKRWPTLIAGTNMELRLGYETALRTDGYKGANINDQQRAAIQTEISQAAESGKLLETFGGINYADPAAWASNGDPYARARTCAVATVLTGAYTFGTLIKPEQKDPAKGLAIAQTGTEQKCGGTAFWLGRIYEIGDTAAPGVDKILGKNPRDMIRNAYAIALINGVVAAHERAGETYLRVPPRYKGKTYFDFEDMESTDYWYGPFEEDYRFARFHYQKCLDATPKNLVCARGLRDVYVSFANPALVQLQSENVKKIEAEMRASGATVPEEASQEKAKSSGDGFFGRMKSAIAGD